jgi:hypothetical protein
MTALHIYTSLLLLLHAYTLLLHAAVSIYDCICILQQVLTVSQVEAAIAPPGWRHVARMSVACFVKPLTDRLRSSSLSRRYEEAAVHSAAAAAVAAAVDSSISASVRAAECVVAARYHGPPPGLPPPVLEHKVSSSTL